MQSGHGPFVGPIPAGTGGFLAELLEVPAPRKFRLELGAPNVYDVFVGKALAGAREEL